ncbi:MAG TPA: hypothetical protein VFA23_04545 [Dongiaceae bacterium]|nr:hypothetical protein [Dongiaceae bacterium]
MPSYRAQEVDYSRSGRAASALAARIVEYWSRLGYPGIHAWVEPTVIDGHSGYAVRSNIRNGLPPAAGRPPMEEARPGSA